jgi:polysaccharide pyruvyl transferase WcaK-like protein
MEGMRSRPVRVFVDHGEAYGNLGDEAMLVQALERVERRFGPCSFVLPRAGDAPLPPSLPALEAVSPPLRTLGIRTDAIARRLGRLSLRPERISVLRLAAAQLLAEAAWSQRLGRRPSAELAALLDTLAGCDVFYGVGAADFSDHWLEGVIYKSWLYRLAAGVVPIVAVSSQGLGPLEIPWARRAAARGFRAVDLLSFRDVSASADLVRAMGIRTPTAVTGDEAWGLAADDEAGRALAVSAGVAPDEQYVAVHFRATDYTRDTRHLASRLAGLLDRLAEVVPYRYLFVPMSYAVHSGDDAAYAAEIRGRMARPEALAIADTPRDVRAAKGLVAGARFSLGLSYHVHVFALSQGLPALVLYTGGYYRAKSDGLVGFFDAAAARAFDLEVAPDETVIDAVAAVDRGYERARCLASEGAAAVAAVNDWLLDRMEELLAAGSPRAEVRSVVEA